MLACCYNPSASAGLEVIPQDNIRYDQLPAPVDDFMADFGFDNDGPKKGVVLPDGSFVIEVEKTAAQSKVGLIVGKCNNAKYAQELEVKAIKQGLIEDYNKNAEPRVQLNAGDRIIKVNNYTGDTKAMLDAISKDPTLRLVCRPCNS